MSESLGKQALGEHPPAPSQLFRSVLPWPGGKTGFPQHRVTQAHSTGAFAALELLQDRTMDVVVTQLATSLRLQGIDEKATAMLALLESLVLAGEISFRDFIGRVRNLFPVGVETIDPLLKQRIASLSAQ